jgi:hypothetical protein
VSQRGSARQQLPEASKRLPAALFHRFTSIALHLAKAGAVATKHKSRKKLWTATYDTLTNNSKAGFHKYQRGRTVNTTEAVLEAARPDQVVILPRETMAHSGTTDEVATDELPWVVLEDWNAPGEAESLIRLMPTATYRWKMAGILEWQLRMGI